MARTEREQRQHLTFRQCLSLRKRLRRKAERRYPRRPLGWRGGVLYFLDTREPVAGARKVPRPDREAVGWETPAAPTGPPARQDPAAHDRRLREQQWYKASRRYE